jgi:hypothetical protein
MNQDMQYNLKANMNMNMNMSIDIDMDMDMATKQIFIYIFSVSKLPKTLQSEDLFVPLDTGHGHGPRLWTFPRPNTASH